MMTLEPNPLPTLKHLDVAINGIIAAQSREGALKVIETIVEWRDWKRDHETI